jgi:hypothetical protein
LVRAAALAFRSPLGKEAVMIVRSLLILSVVLALQAAAHAETTVRYGQPAVVAPPTTVQSAVNYERVSGRNNPALNYFGGGTPAPVYTPRPQANVVPPPVPVRTAPIAKPFSGVQQAAALTPYLGLDATRENESSIPNYFLYVKPAIDQQHVNRVQHAQTRRLQQQVRTAAAPGVVTSAAGGIPTTGHSSQFMNNGGYYPTLQR